MLSPIEKLIFLKEIPFFAQMSIEQLKVLGNLCEEAFFEEKSVIFREGEPGGALYMVVAGRGAITREALRQGTEPSQMATPKPPSPFCAMTPLVKAPRSPSGHPPSTSMLIRPTSRTL